jgi:hypothetical protein
MHPFGCISKKRMLLIEIDLARDPFTPNMNTTLFTYLDLKRLSKAGSAPWQTSRPADLSV